MNTPNHMMVSYTGDLVNTISWHTIRPAHAYCRHRRTIKTGRDLRASLRAGDYSWPGCYPIAYATEDGAALCPDCVRKNLRVITESIRHGNRDGWRVASIFLTNECDEQVLCDNCSETIE